jgi:hypothetical protein
MYNTKHVCKYNSPDVFLESDEVTENEKQFIRDVLYRNDLLSIFEIDEYDATTINNQITELYNTLTNDYAFRQLMSKLSAEYSINDETLGLITLFSFDFLEFTHKCISELIETGKISKKSISNLQNKVFS